MITKQTNFGTFGGKGEGYEELRFHCLRRLVDDDVREKTFNIISHHIYNIISARLLEGGGGGEPMVGGG